MERAGGLVEVQNDGFADERIGNRQRTDDGATVGRRGFLKAAGVVTAGMTLPSASVSASASGQGEENHSYDGAEALEMGPDRFTVGGRHLVGLDGYGTIQAAWDAASDGDVVYVHSSYDAEAAGEQFPVELDFREKEVLLSGGHPSGSVIDARHSDETVLEVTGKGHTDYRNNPFVQSLQIIGGDVGMRVRAAPYASFKDLVFWSNGSHGVEVAGHEVDGTDYGTFGVTFRNCVAWNCGGDGFRLNTGANPHSTTFYGCHSLLNDGVGLRLRGYASRWRDGTIQNNGGFGVDARSGCSQRVDGTYVEGNDTTADAPVEVYVAESAPGFTLHGAYFQGGFFRDFDNGRDTGRWGVVVDGAPHADIRNCSFRNYTDSFLRVDGAVDVDVHLASHCDLDDTTPIQHSDCTRLRSDGTALPADLTDAAPGQFVGDAAIHDGSGDCPWGLALWDGDDWTSVMNGQTI